uniref:Ulp1 protease-like protein n=1 Tax=Oryza sativa subsp. japonica TaxID=39947 RepID=Q69P82_ORYSJ|nr:ulp1 protease-like protein [Oryza sativa Japonica Group]
MPRQHHQLSPARLPRPAMLPERKAGEEARRRHREEREVAGRPAATPDASSVNDNMDPPHTMSYTGTDCGYMEGVPDKERQPEFYMETTRTTRIVSILVSLVLLGQGDIYGRDESVIFDLAEHELEEEDYPVVDYESDLQTAISTTIR